MLALCGVFTLVCVWCAREPDFDLLLVREVPSPLSLTQLGAKLDQVSKWPEWHHMMKETRVVPLKEGSGEFLVLTFVPKGLEWKKFVLTVQVNERRPGRLVRYSLLNDTKGKLPKLFTSVVWELEVLEGKDFPSMVRAKVIAHTQHWRSRLIGRLLPEVLLNQVLYPDLDRLAGTPAAFRVPIMPE